MTEETSEETGDPATGEAPSTENIVPAQAPPAPNSLSGKGKTFWAGVGIGSAALVAALMYARRPKKRK